VGSAGPLASAPALVSAEKDAAATALIKALVDMSVVSCGVVVERSIDDDLSVGRG
jgi:hypothetical protein